MIALTGPAALQRLAATRGLAASARVAVLLGRKAPPRSQGRRAGTAVPARRDAATPRTVATVAADASRPRAGRRGEAPAASVSCLVPGRKLLLTLVRTFSRRGTARALLATGPQLTSSPVRADRLSAAEAGPDRGAEPEEGRPMRTASARARTGARYCPPAIPGPRAVQRALSAETLGASPYSGDEGVRHRRDAEPVILPDHPDVALLAPGAAPRVLPDPEVDAVHVEAERGLARVDPDADRAELGALRGEPALAADARVL